MKRIIGLLFFTILTLSGFAQDLIIKVDDDEINAKITQIDRNRILYINADRESSEVEKINKDEVYMVIYEDGLKQYFTIASSQQFLEDLASDSSLLMFDRGSIDAKRFFENDGPFWGTFAASAVPLYGIVSGALTGAIVGATPPHIYAEDLPDPELFYQNAEYAQGFQKEAHRKKVRKVLKGFGLGMGIQVVIILIIAASW